MHAKHIGTCWNCKETLGDDHFGRQDVCPHCQQETRVCKNCFFYDPLCYNACREIQAERIVDKEKANFCDFFRSVPPTSGTRLKKIPKPAGTPRQAAEALFKTK